MKAMILAAGRGERMRPLTDHTPKPLLPAGGRPLIVYHLEKLAQAGYREVVVNLAHLAEKIPARLGDGRRWGLRIHYLREPPGALDTGGGIRNALPWLGERFLVINGDVWTDRPLTPPTLGSADLAHLVLVDNPPHHPEGDFALVHGRVLDSGGQRLTFAGIGWYRAALFHGLPRGRYPLAPVLRRAIRRSRVAGERHRGRWTDVGTPERLHLLDQELGARRPPTVGVTDAGDA